MATARFAARRHAARHTDERVCDDQAAVDLAFRDLEFILAAEHERPLPNYDRRCRNKACVGN